MKSSLNEDRSIHFLGIFFFQFWRIFFFQRNSGPFSFSLSNSSQAATPAWETHRTGAFKMWCFKWMVTLVWWRWWQRRSAGKKKKEEEEKKKILTVAVTCPSQRHSAPPIPFHTVDTTTKPPRGQVGKEKRRREQIFLMVCLCGWCWLGLFFFFRLPRKQVKKKVCFVNPNQKRGPSYDILIPLSD